MRIWDIHPGYLNRQSLLGEHREIHGLFLVVHENKKGYSRHPETLRWVGKLTALKQRHDLLVAEMTLRGYNHHSPMPWVADEKNQKDYIDLPYRQFEILREKYRQREPGRIPLPRNSQELWAQHKYSILSRDPDYYKAIGPRLSQHPGVELTGELSLEFVQCLTVAPTAGRLLNGLLHMWGYVSRYVRSPQPPGNMKQLLDEICRLAILHKKTYLLHSTALSDLALYVNAGETSDSPLRSGHDDPI